MVTLAAASLVTLVLPEQPATATAQKLGPLKAAKVNHQTHRAKMESLDLAAQLVPVPGYTYLDPSRAEVDAYITRIRQYEEQISAPGFIAAASFHSVVAKAKSQNRSHTASGASEVGFLQLYAYSVAPPAGLDTDQRFFSTQHDGKAPVAKMQLSGTTVFVFAYPNEPNSRFQYSWLRHGVAANFDGAARAPLERWLRLYLALPNPSPGETAALAARLVPVNGFAFVNLASPRLMKTMVTAVFGRRPHSLHEIVDNSGSLAALILVSVPKSVTTADAVADYAKQFPGDYGAPVSMSVAGVTVEKVTSAESTSTYTWATGGVVGVIVSQNTAQAEAFLGGLLDGWKANGWT